MKDKPFTLIEEASSSLELGDRGEDTLLLGYRMPLTPAEHRVLCLLASDTEHSLTRRDISELSLDGGAASVNVHVCSINKKASLISDRKLIIIDEKGEYRLNKNL